MVRPPSSIVNERRLKPMIKEENAKSFTHLLIKKLLRLQEFFVGKEVKTNMGSVMPNSAYSNK